MSVGSLDKITANLTFNTGDGGNGGAKDAIYLSAAGSKAALTDGKIETDRVLRLGNTGDIFFNTTPNGGVSLFVKLSAKDDTLQVTGANSRTQAFLFGGDGNDTLSVGTAGASLGQLSGIVAFFGEEGSADVLNAYGVALPPDDNDSSNQLTAIAITGLGSNANKNQFISTHNDLFGAGYTIPNVAILDATLAAAQLTMARIQDLTEKLRSPARPIDQYVAESLSMVTEKSLYGLAVGDQVVFRVNNSGSSPVPGLVADQAYFVRSVTETEIGLSASQSDGSPLVVFPRSLVGIDCTQVSLAVLDTENFATLDASPQLNGNALIFADPHGLTTGQPFVYRPGTGNARIGGLNEGTVYFAIRLSDVAISIAATAQDAEALDPVAISLKAPANDVLINDDQSTFNAFSGVASDTITVPSPHSFATGQTVIYRSGNVSAAGNIQTVGGLVDGAVYYVIRKDATSIQLAASADDAKNNVPLAITGLPATTSNLDSITVRRSFNQASEVTASFNASSNVAADTIQFASDHGFTQGQAVVYQPGNATPLTGLNEGQTYYVIRTSNTELQLALTAADAASTPAKAIAITALGSAINQDTLTSRRAASQAFIVPDDNGGRIVFGNDPGFIDGQAVVYNAGIGSGPIGLIDGAVYFVKRVAGNSRAIELTETRNGPSVALTPATADSLAVDTLSPAVIIAPTSVNNENDTIHFSLPHGLVAGQRLVYRPGYGNGPIGGLMTGNAYRVQLSGADSIQLVVNDGKAPLNIESRLSTSLLPVVVDSADELLAMDLNGLIQGPSLYDAQRFEQIILRPETLQLLSQFPQGNPVLNRLLLEDAYPESLPRLDSLTPDLPAAIYYAQRFRNRAGAETLQSTVETVNILLSGIDNTMYVDSTLKGTTTIEGGFNTTVVVGSTPEGLHPAQNRRVSYIDGTLNINAAKITLDDSGNDQSTVGVLERDRVIGLGMPGQTRFTGTPSVLIKLGANDDTFYIPATSRDQSVRLESGGGFDTTYLGTRPGSEATGDLSELQGSLTLDGGAVQSGLNALFINDHATTTPQEFLIENDYDWTVSGNSANSLDTTTITRSGKRIVQFTRQEIVSLSAGSGGNNIDVRQTHREQSTDGSASSTFTINAGAGSDVITLGQTVGTNGERSMEGFQQTIGIPVFTGASSSPRGIPVLINGQGGTDAIRIVDSATSQSTNLGLTQKSFRDVFPEAPDARTDSVDIYRDVFGDDPLARSLTTVAMSDSSAQPINVYVRQTANQSTRAANENMSLFLTLGSAGDVVQLLSAPYDLDLAIATGDGMDTINVENGVRMLHGHTLNVNTGNDDDTTYVDYNGISVLDPGGVGLTVTKVSFDRDSADAGRSGYSPLSPGQYLVETRFQSGEWQFRVVDAKGVAVAVSDLDTPNGLIANWQNIRRASLVEDPGSPSRFVYRFNSHRGLILEFTSAYHSTGDSLVGAMALDLIANGFGQVVEATIGKFGNLNRTIHSVAFSSDDVVTGNQLDANADYFVQTRWDASNKQWQFRIWNNSSNKAVAIRNVASNSADLTDTWQSISSVMANASGERAYASGTGIIITFAQEFESGSVDSENAMALQYGVPANALTLALDGGSQSASGAGDMLRISGDGKATGARYNPSSTLPGGGAITVSGNTFQFRGIEPLIVHGLPDFQMLTPDKAAALVIDSTNLADTFKQQLQLHTLTIEGQVTWTQKRQFDVDRTVMDPRSLGRAIAISDDGLTMVVGAKATPIGSAVLDQLTDGMVIVYGWNGNAWIEKARLQPSDAKDGLNFGGGFGASVAIDGNRMVIGAPGDIPGNAPVVASFEPSSVDDNSVSFSGPHGLVANESIVYSRGWGYGDIGLIDGQVYYAKLVANEPNKLQFSLNPRGPALPLSVQTAAPDRLGPFVHPVIDHNQQQPHCVRWRYDADHRPSGRLPQRQWQSIVRIDRWRDLLR